MVPLPNYVVIDFLEWMREYHKDAQELVYQRESWERHNEYIYKYINEYLEKDYRYFNKDSYKHNKVIFKRWVNRLIDSEEFDDGLRGYWHVDNACAYNEYFDLATEELRYLSHKTNSENRNLHAYNALNGIEAEQLYYSIRDYVYDHESDDYSHLSCFMINGKTNNLSTVLDFLEWLKSQQREFNISEMPDLSFDWVIEEYESDRNKSLSKKDKKDIKKCFKDKKPNKIEDWFNQKLGRKVDLNQVFDRYYNNRAKFKCILLPIDGQIDYKYFFKVNYDNLHFSSKDSLDIFYCPNELSKTGYIVLDELGNLDLDVNELPCIAIWENDIHAAKSINIKQLNENDLFDIFQAIINFINQDFDLKSIVEEANDMADRLRKEKKPITNIYNKVEQNIENNYGVATISNEGEIKNSVKIINGDLKDEISEAKKALNKIEELESEQKEFLCKLLDELREANDTKNKKAVDECKKTFNTFVIGAGKIGKVVVNALSVFGSVASILGLFIAK